MFRGASTRDGEMFTRGARMLKIAYPKHRPCMYLLNDAEFDSRWPEADVEVVYERVVVQGFYALRCVGDDIEILRLVVSPKFRQCGIGGAMLQDIIKTKKNLAITINEYDTAAVSWFVKRGFKARRGGNILLRRSKNEQS